MSIRAADRRDAPALTSLWNAMIRDTLATFTTQEQLYTDIEVLIGQRRGAFWVAEDKGKLAGFVTWGPFRSGPGYAATVEHTIILAPEARGKGTGRDLMEQAMTIAAQSGVHIMVAAISGANPDAVRFHAALGFTQTALMPELGRKRGQWLDLILMQKTLTPP